MHDILPIRTAPATRDLHIAAIVTLCFTFPLIFLGGLVTSHGAGMSVPDWPNSYGYNMFLFPPSRWTGGILFEHTHRLLGTVVGFCATVMTLVAWGPARTLLGRKVLIGVFIGLEAVNALGTAAMLLVPDLFKLPATARSAGAILPQGAVTAIGILLTIAVAWFCRRREPRRWVRWVATGSLVAVCLQGLLGGMRVDLVNLTLAIVHGCFAQLTFCLILVTAIATGKWWARSPSPGPRPEYQEVGSEKRIFELSVLTVFVIYTQLIVGAIMRHNKAGLAIPDIPLAYGHWLPPISQQQMDADNHLRVWQLGLEPVTLPQVWIHFTHRLGAVIVSAVVITLSMLILLRSKIRGLAGPAVVLIFLLITQVTLGLYTVLKGKPADVASAHVATGALLLATAVLTAMRAARIRFQSGRRSTHQKAVTASRSVTGVSALVCAVRAVTLSILPATRRGESSPLP